MKGSSQSDKPQPRVIIPSAAYGGAIISFVLCPTELMKVIKIRGLQFFTLLLIVFLWQRAFQCRMQVQGTDSSVPLSSRYSSPLDCAAKTIQSEGVRKFFAFLEKYQIWCGFELMEHLSG